MRNVGGPGQPIATPWEENQIAVGKDVESKSQEQQRTNTTQLFSK